MPSEGIKKLLQPFIYDAWTLWRMKMGGMGHRVIIFTAEHEKFHTLTWVVPQLSQRCIAQQDSQISCFSAIGIGVHLIGSYNMQKLNWKPRSVVYVVNEKCRFSQLQWTAKECFWEGLGIDSMSSPVFNARKFRRAFCLCEQVKHLCPDCGVLTGPY